MAGTVPLAKVVSLVVDSLNTLLPEQVSDGHIAHTFPPIDGRGWVVVSSLAGGNAIATMGSGAGILETVVQVSSYGVSRVQAQGIADAVADAMIGRTGDDWTMAMVGSGFTIAHRALYFDMRMGVLESGLVPDLFFVAPDRFLLTVCL